MFKLNSSKKCKKNKTKIYKTSKNKTLEQNRTKLIKDFVLFYKSLDGSVIEL
jgi:hypothetical protein